MLPGSERFPEAERNISMKKKFRNRFKANENGEFRKENAPDGREYRNQGSEGSTETEQGSEEETDGTPQEKKKLRILPTAIAAAAAAGVAIGILVGVGNVQKQEAAVQASAAGQVSAEADADDGADPQEKIVTAGAGDEDEKNTDSKDTDKKDADQTDDEKSDADAKKDRKSEEKSSEKDSDSKKTDDKAEDKESGQSGSGEAENTDKNPAEASNANDAAASSSEGNAEVPQSADGTSASGTGGNQTSSEAETYEPSAITPTPAPHTHNWQEVIRTIHHDAVTEQVKVVDTAAYSEPVYQEVPVYETVVVNICNVCGEEFEDEYTHSYSHIDWDTMTNPFSYTTEFRQGAQIGTEKKQTGTIAHPEVSHMETKVITAAYDEQVVDGYVCTGCGARK